MVIFFAVGPSSYHPFTDPDQALEFVDRVLAEDKAPSNGWRIMSLKVKSVEEALAEYKETKND